MKVMQFRKKNDFVKDMNDHGKWKSENCLSIDAMLKSIFTSCLKN
jgi:hypothetical protein